MSNKQKIQNYLVSYDSIIKAITTYGLKDVVTLEQGNFMYWIRRYINGNYEETYCYHTNLDDAIKGFNSIVNDLNKHTVRFKYNKV